VDDFANFVNIRLARDMLDLLQYGCELSIACCQLGCVPVADRYVKGNSKKTMGGITIPTDFATHWAQQEQGKIGGR